MACTLFLLAAPVTGVDGTEQVLSTGVLSQAKGQDRLLQEIQSTKVVPQKQKTRACSGHRGEIRCDGALEKKKSYKCTFFVVFIFV